MGGDMGLMRKSEAVNFRVRHWTPKATVRFKRSSRQMSDCGAISTPSTCWPPGFLSIPDSCFRVRVSTDFSELPPPQASPAQWLRFPQLLIPDNLAVSAICCLGPHCWPSSPLSPSLSSFHSLPSLITAWSGLLATFSSLQFLPTLDSARCPWLCRPSDLQ